MEDGVKGGQGKKGQEYGTLATCYKRIRLLGQHYESRRNNNDFTQEESCWPRTSIAACRDTLSTDSLSLLGVVQHNTPSLGKRRLDGDTDAEMYQWDTANKHPESSQRGGIHSVGIQVSWYPVGDSAYSVAEPWLDSGHILQ